MKTLILSAITVCFFLSVSASENEKVKIKADKQTGYLPLTVRFDVGDETPGVAYTWDFGNGNTSTLKTPRALFVNPGTYNVKVVTNNGTQSDSTTMTITVLQNDALINNMLKARASND